MGTTTITPPKPKTRAKSTDGGRGPAGFGDGGFGGEGRSWQVPARTYRTGMWMGLVAILMLFAAFTSALVVRKGISNDWVRTAIPRILWLNTVVLIASSITLELARRSLAARFADRFVGWWSATTGLGLAFIAGQLLAWRQLVSRGVYLATNPSSSFFYLLTAAHGVHLLGGLIALSYVLARARRIVLAREKSPAVGVTAIYWHFMDGLWIYIFVLLLTRS